MNTHINFDNIRLMYGCPIVDWKEIDKDLVDYINSKIEERAEAKKNKDYKLADSIRDELTEKGIKLIDTKDGTKYEVIKN